MLLPENQFRLSSGCLRQVSYVQFFHFWAMSAQQIQLREKQEDSFRSHHYSPEAKHRVPTLKRCVLQTPQREDAQVGWKFMILLLHPPLALVNQYLGKKTKDEICVFTSALLHVYTGHLRFWRTESDHLLKVHQMYLEENKFRSTFLPGFVRPTCLGSTILGASFLSILAQGRMIRVSTALQGSVAKN